MTWAEYVSTKPAGNATVVIGLTYGNSNFTEDFPRKASSQGNTSSTNTPLAAKASKAYACHDQQMYKISIYQNWGKDMSGHTVEMIFEKMPADDVAFSQCTPRAPVLEEGAFECNMTNTNAPVCYDKAENAFSLHYSVKACLHQTWPKSHPRLLLSLHHRHVWTTMQDWMQNQVKC